MVYPNVAPEHSRVDGVNLGQRGAGKWVLMLEGPLSLFVPRVLPIMEEAARVGGQSFWVAAEWVVWGPSRM